MTQLTKIHITGYRNFQELTVNFTNKVLILGANDIGKTNLLHAVRLLLDPSLSEAAMEAVDSDFCIYDNSNSITITLTFSEVDDCIKSRMKGFVNDSDMLYIRYVATRNPDSGQKDYKISASHSSDHPYTDLPSRVYLRSLHMRYISSRRDLNAFIRKERQHLFEEARKTRTQQDITSDTERLSKITDLLSEVALNTNALSYVQSVSTKLNDELSKLSHHHGHQTTELSASNTDVDTFINNIGLVSKRRNRTLPVSGDGRTNQVHFALWAAKTAPPPTIIEITILCIEEPEAHLHPHQQRRLSDYLANISSGQVIMTSHSPQIASEFPVDSIVRLFATPGGTSVAGEGCDIAHQNSALSLGYRLGVLTAESLFSSAAFLVEGVSERVFFLALLQHPSVNFDINRENITILSVEGVSFSCFSDYLNSFQVPYAARTDNDVSKVPYKPFFRLPGLERLLALPAHLNTSTLDPLREQYETIKHFDSCSPPPNVVECVNQMRPILEQNGLFLAENDLEADIYSVFSESLHLFYKTTDRESTLARMKTQKAINMFSWISEWPTLAHCDIVAQSITNHQQEIEQFLKPINFLVNLIKMQLEDRGTNE